MLPSDANKTQLGFVTRKYSCILDTLDKNLGNKKKLVQGYTATCMPDKQLKRDHVQLFKLDAWCTFLNQLMTVLYLYLEQRFLY